MSLKAIVKYLDYRFKKEETQNVATLYTTESIVRLSKMKLKTGENVSFAKVYQQIWGIEQKEDNRKADEIIKDTFAKHGIKIKQNNKEADE